MLASWLSSISAIPKTPTRTTRFSSQIAAVKTSKSLIPKTVVYRISINTVEQHLLELLLAKRIAIYLRVSTPEQSVENQRLELEAVAARHGWNVVAIFEDQGFSGSKGRDGRPGFDKLCHAAARREFDQIAAWSVDRLGRSLQGLITFLAELKAKGIDLYLHQQGLDTSTPSGNAMFQMLGVFAEFERAMIAERVKAGLARARKNGKRLGRPMLSDSRELAVRKLLSDNVGIVKTARAVGVGVSAVQRIKRAMA